MASPRGRVALSLGPLALALLLVCALLPASALGAPPSGEGQLTFVPASLGFGPITVGAESAEEQVEVGNQSGVAISISNVSLQGTDAADFSIASNSCGGVLANGEVCFVRVRFSPHSAGAKNASLRITSSDEPGEDEVALSGTAAVPQLAFEPGSYDFGLQPVHGEGGAETNLQLRNTGPASIHIDNIGFEGPGAEAFSTGNSNCFGATLASGQTCSLEIDFRPRDTVPYAASLRVVASGSAFAAPLAGEGGDAIVSASPSPTDFGTVGIGGAGLTQTITLTNSGDLSANFFIAFLSGGDVADFRLLSEDCTAAPIDPGAACSAQVRFAPESVGAKSAKLTFIAGGEGGPMQIDLSGVGLAPLLGLGPAGLAFGPQASGSSSPPQVATLTNSGASPVEVDAATILGADADQFRLGDSCTGTVLASGQSCQLSVRFSPDREGQAGAVLRVLAGGQRLSASLAATAIAPGTTPRPAMPAPICRVPRLAGRSLAVAARRLKAAHCALGKVTKKKGATAKDGEVIGSSPKPGKVLPAGAKIRVTLAPRPGSARRQPSGRYPHKTEIDEPSA